MVLRMCIPVSLLDLPDISPCLLSRLHEHNLKLKGSKCEFFKGQVSYLGHIVSEQGIQTDPEKIEVVKTWPVPTTVKEVRQFLGFTGYYRRFIQGYASIARPLNDLLVGNCENTKSGKSKSSKKKGKGFEWGTTQQEAFDSLIDKLTSPPVLAYADYRYSFQVHTDASTSGLGAVLYQHQDGKDRVVAYASRSLKPAEKNYPAHKLEFLALKWAITEKFHDYLYGSKFEVLTDNNPLTYILTTAKLDATGQRWVAALSTYNFSLTYRSGSQNADADGLSRLPATCEKECSFPEILRAMTGAITVPVDEIPLATCLSLDEPPSATCEDEEIPEETLKATALSCEDWAAAQKSDKFISKIVDFITEGQRPSANLIEEQHIDRRFLRDWDKLFIEDGVLFRQGEIDGQTWNQLVLPRKLYDSVFQSYHDDLGHQGRDRTISLLKRRFFWPGMETYVDQKIKECGRCIRRKKSPTTAAELINITSTAPMELICIDYLSLERSKGGYENILVITDHFSRYAQAIPTRNQTARTTARVLYEQFFVHYGFPAKIHSDKGANFESKVIQSLCRITGMKKTRTTPYHPMGNGMVERFNRTLLNMLGTLTSTQKSDWKSHVSTLCHAYNAAVHDSTGYVPFYLMFGRHPRLAIDAFLGLKISGPQCRTPQDYAGRLKERLAFAYDAAAREARKNARRHKENYDRKVRFAKLESGDRVLVRNVGIRGKQKLADIWEHSPYIVKRQPIEGIPVYEVYKETSSHPKMRLLHRNMLLPFMGLPSYEESEEEQAAAPAGKTPVLSSSDSFSSGNSSTEDSSDVERFSNEAPTDQRQQEATSDRNRRGRRKRQPPERYQAGQAVIQEYTFSVPSSQVCIL